MSAKGLTLYVDARVMCAGTQHVSFGPFSSHKRAEKALIALMSRENVLDAHVRNPDGY